MKAHMEEVEDDLAAEEENKLINEVRRVLPLYCLYNNSSTKYGITAGV